MDIAEYLPEEERVRIAKDAFHEVCLAKFRSDAERIFSNAAYKAVWEVVDEQFDGKAAQMVAEKIPAIIDGPRRILSVIEATPTRDEILEEAARAVEEAGYYCLPPYDETGSLPEQIDHCAAAIRAMKGGEG